MDAADHALIEKARPHFLAAMASFGRRGDAPRRVAQGIAQQAKLAGFSKPGRRRLMDYLHAFLGDLLLSRMDPFLYGTPAENPRALFAPETLGGLFDPRPAPADAAQGELPLGSTAEARNRALIEQPIAATRLHAASASVQELLSFTIRLRAFAPFNAMLLHIQKPGLGQAA